LLCPEIDINVGHGLYAVTFSANGEYLLTGDWKGVGVWRVEDGKQMTTVEVGIVQCLAVSNDGRWIAAGTDRGGVFVWDATTYEKVISHRGDYHTIYGIDFSPDATRLVSASDDASIWDIATRKRVQTLDHGDSVRAAKYSPQGDRIATATRDSVRVYASSDGHLLVNIPVTVTPWYNTGLLWFNNNLFVVSNGTIKQIEASTGSTISEWSVPDSNHLSCIALPKHGEFIAHSTPRTTTFWDTATHTQLGLNPIQHPSDIRSITVSPDDRFLATGGRGGKITIYSLSPITVSILSRWIVVHMNNFLTSIIFPRDSIPLSCLHPTIQEPDIRIDGAALHSWKHNQLPNAEALLTAAIHESRGISHHALASRALVRARLRHWDAAIADATEVFVARLSHALSLIYIKSIKIQPSVIGYIAKSVALVGNGEKYNAYRTCDIAFERCHSTHVTFLLLIKVGPMRTRAWLPSDPHTP
jgi:hypothetical protein